MDHTWIVLTQYRRVTDGRTDGQTHGIAVPANNTMPAFPSYAFNWWRCP